MKKVVIIILLFFIFLPTKVFAQSSYVLPYPSAMPGNKFYVLDQIKEKILLYWYFGNFGQFTYNLKLADKYLVESKTLFEYDQYLLATKSLQKSNDYFIKAPLFLQQAKQEGKDISEQEALLHSAASKHSEVLKKLEKGLPEQFTWQPEKKESTVLHVHDMLEKAIEIRMKK